MRRSSPHLAFLALPGLPLAGSAARLPLSATLAGGGSSVATPPTGIHSGSLSMAGLRSTTHARAGERFSSGSDLAQRRANLKAQSRAGRGLAEERVWEGERRAPVPLLDEHECVGKAGGDLSTRGPLESQHLIWAS